MAIQKLEKPAWHPYFDEMSRFIIGKQAEVEVAALNIGDQIEAEWLPLMGVTYDHKDDLLEVLMDGLDHLIRKPAEIYVDYGPTGLVSIEVVDADGVKQIVRLRDPLMLPPPQAKGSAGTASP